jgi:alpha-tubulin suppressor-like RCC1 family protein
VATGCGISGGAQPGILYCWGENADGQAARDPMVDQPVIIPVQVPDPTPQIADGWIRASVALRHGCGILSENGTSGRLFCWGYNGSGERGDEGPSDHNLRQVGVDADWIDVDTGVAHTCALRSGGTLHCFGANSSGQLGDGSADSHALPGPTVGGMSDWVGVAAGNSTSCGIRGAARVLYCWGENHYGQVGDGNSVRWTPAPVPRP